MGSKRDGVHVDWAKHHIRTGRKVRAQVRSGVHPSVAPEEPKHKKKSGAGPHPQMKLRVYAVHASGYDRRVSYGTSHRTVSAAMNAIRSDQNKGGWRYAYMMKEWGPVVKYEIRHTSGLVRETILP